VQPSAATLADDEGGGLGVALAAGGGADDAAATADRVSGVGPIVVVEARSGVQPAARVSSSTAGRGRLSRIELAIQAGRLASTLAPKPFALPPTRPAGMLCGMPSRRRLPVALALFALVPFLASWGHRRPPPDDGLVCAGRLVLLGDPLAQVLEKCGPPASGTQQCDASGHHCNGTWTYRPSDGSFPRYVGFTDDVVRSIQAGSRFE